MGQRLREFDQDQKNSPRDFEGAQIKEVGYGQQTWDLFPYYNNHDANDLYVVGINVELGSDL